MKSMQAGIRKYLRSLSIVGIIVMMILPTSCRAPKEKDRSLESMDQIETLLDSGYYNEALIRLRLLTSENDLGIHPAPDSILSRAYMLIGNIHLSYNDFQEALSYYDKALEKGEGDPARLHHILQNATVAACVIGNRELAVDYNQRLDSLPVQPRYKSRKMYDIIIGRAYIEKYFGEPDRGAAGFRKAIGIVREVGLGDRELATPLSELYEYYSERQTTDSTLYYLLAYDTLARKFHIPQMMADSKRGLLHSYILLGDKEKALQTYEEYFTIIDSIYQPHMFISLNNSYHRTNITEANRRIESLKSEVSLQKVIMIFLILLLLVAVALLLLRKRILEVRRILYRQNKEIVSLEKKISNRTDQSSSRSMEIMARIGDLLDDSGLLCDPDLSLEMVAKKIGSNAKYVSMAINESTGENFRTYINTRRIHEARKRLTEPGEYSNLTLRAIGESVGFRSHANFINAFKKVTGLTPSLYLKLARENSGE